MTDNEFGGDEKGAAEAVMSWGAEMTGAAIGGTVGAVFTGPIGAAGGGIAGVVIARGLRLAADFAHRQLSARERVRIGAAFTFAIDRIRANYASGLEPRADGFFEVREADRPDADTLLEGVVTKCRDEYQEKKVRLLANIYGNVAFDKNVASAAAATILEVAARLTYRQLCMVALAGRPSEFGVVPFKEFTRGEGPGDPVIRWEWQELYNRYWLIRKTDDIPSLTQMGGRCFHLMQLGDLASGDVAAVWNEIKAGLRHHPEDNPLVGN